LHRLERVMTRLGRPMSSGVESTLPVDTTMAHRGAAWHAMEATEVESALHSTSHGLTAEDVESRLAHHGPNQLEDDPPTPRLVVLARQFRSPLIYILVAATVVTRLLGEYIDAAVIATVLLINAVIGFTQERKAEGAVRALMHLVVPHARVEREGHEQEIDSRELVPGDVVLLEPGSKVPADLRLVTANALQVDESLLTGPGSRSPSPSRWSR
jgi:Ca2+-transporting ATPase